MSGTSDVDKKVAEKYPRRTLGRTGERISIITFGGIVVKNAEPEHAARVVAEAVEKGINYFDVAPRYGDAEEKLGPALKPYRDNVLLACKTWKRDRKEAEEELHRSLKRLQTDHFDVYQLHGIRYVEKDVKTALGKGGAMEAILEAKKQGLVRYIGFSAHSSEAALTAMREFDFDTIMYPVSFVTHYANNFESEVLAEAKKRKMGIIGIKAMAKQRWQGEEGRERWPKCWYEPIGERELARKALSWTLSQGVSTAVPPGEESLYKMAVELAPGCKLPTNDELSELKDIAGKCEALFSI
ncbi:MAG: aldo/keto reductase [Planctomycetota bacterium]|nr:MAG: aldo/keto reductase [Planctomycetota bacterium]